MGARRLLDRLRLWRLSWLRLEIRVVPTERQRLFVLTIVIGALCGLAAVAFHLAIRRVEHAVVVRAMTAPGHAWIAWTALAPVLGGLVAGVLLQYVVPEVRGSGIPQVKVAYAREGARLGLRDAVGKFVVAVIQIGSGASLGREGPTVQICAGLASALGRLAALSPASLRQLLPVGAAAGIAAAFNAPLAAVTFTIEEVVGNLDQTVLAGVVVAAALAAAVERSVLGEHPVFTVPSGYGLHHESSLVFYAVLGVAAAVVSVAFTDALLVLRQRFQRMQAVPAWARPALGGLVTGLLAVAALAGLGTRGVTGGGYETLGTALTGQLAVRAMVVLCAMKVVATVASYSSGGAGGIFAPSLFIGGMLGGVVGALDIAVLHHPADTLGAFALVGMGAVFAGIIRAPITSVLIIVEMTGGYSLILPLMIANMTAYALARHWRPVPIYEALLAQDGVRLNHDLPDLLGTLTVGGLIDRSAGCVTLARTASAREALDRADAVRQEVFPVVDTDGRLVGLIAPEELRLLRGEPQIESLVVAADLMRPPVALREDAQLRAAFDVMLAEGLREVPVVDAAGRVVGMLGESAIARVWLHPPSR